MRVSCEFSVKRGGMKSKVSLVVDSVGTKLNEVSRHRVESVEEELGSVDRG